jgi:hypothetical protein
VISLEKSEQIGKKKFLLFICGKDAILIFCQKKFKKKYFIKLHIILSIFDKNDF